MRVARLITRLRLQTFHKNKDDENTDLNWDLKNNARVPIASGLYIIHVDCGELGEKVLKWMGIMRELDLDSF
jgi:hypothetical protein